MPITSRKRSVINQIYNTQQNKLELKAVMMIMKEMGPKNQEMMTAAILTVVY